MWGPSVTVCGVGGQLTPQPPWGNCEILESRLGQQGILPSTTTCAVGV